MEDSAILDMYFARDEQAIFYTGQKYGRLLYSIAKNVLHSHEDSEEIVSDTYGKAWNHIPPDRPNIFSAYLSKITRNLSINAYNKNKAAKRYSGLDIPLSELSDCIPTKDDEFEMSQLTEAINAWLATLSDDDRAIFVKRYFFCTPVNQLATEVKTTANKLAGRLLRLRKKLKTALEREGIEL